MNIWEIIAPICAGLAVCIPLAVKLVQAAREAAEKGNWDKIVGMVARLMAEAEGLLETSADKTAWVLAMLHENAAALDYVLTDSDWAKISDMIDALCTMAKVVNGPEEVAA